MVVSANVTDKFVATDTGLCMTGGLPGLNVTTVGLRPCDDYSSNQKVNIFGVMGPKPGGDVHMAIGSNWLLQWSGYLAESTKTEDDGGKRSWNMVQPKADIDLSQDPFTIQWSDGRKLVNPDTAGTLLFGQGAATEFLRKTHADDCKKYGIPLNQCYKTTRDDCTKYDNYKRDSCLPQVCPTTDGSYIDKPECQNWCTNHPGECDSAASAWCKKPENAEDTAFCGCFNKLDPPAAAATDQGLAYAYRNPQCYLQQCRSGATAYKTKNFKEDPCNTTISICSSTINQVAGNAIQGSNYVTQNCTADSTTEKGTETINETTAAPVTTSSPSGDTTAAPGTTSAPGTTTTAAPSTETSKKTLYIVGFAGLCLFIMCCLISLSAGGAIALT